MIFISSFFDATNYTQPISYFLDDYFFPLFGGKTPYLLTTISNNSLELDDNLFGLATANNSDYFLQISSTVERVATSEMIGAGI